MANVSKRRTKKNIPVGVAHIHSTFNILLLLSPI